ncbi:MAG: hypothetical protein PUP93_14120, partial [Rhizonema sp. NSF051]|nr:hypothetical protein [Rhizonema sp. NSF051]
MCSTPLGNVIGSTATPNNHATPVIERSPTTPPISYPLPAPTSPTYTLPQSLSRPILILTHTNGKEFRLLG